MGNSLKSLFSLSERIRVLPVVHGSGNFNQIVRQNLLGEPCDCIAVSLPSEFRHTLEEGIENLPTISVSLFFEPSGVCNYVPIDPCQPSIMALRIGKQENIAREYIDWSTPTYENRNHIFPDTFALRQLPYDKFCVSILPSIPKPKSDSLHDKRARWMAYQLHRLELEYKHIVFVCSFLDWPWVKEAFDERKGYPPPTALEGEPSLYGLEKNTLFFALAEMPYVTYLYEKNRLDLRSDLDTAIDGVKAILLRARDIYTRKYKVKYHNLTSQTFQYYLQYVRNLSLIENRLTPDLYTLVNAARQTDGDRFAMSLVEAAREYPYQNNLEHWETLTLGINQAAFDEDHIVEMKNRLSETQYIWRNLNLKKIPDFEKQNEWKYRWNPHRQCSWPPEDDKIESFNTHIRDQAKLLLSNDLARSEKFTSSVKDGLDIRETIRHWYTGDIYVKEIPPSRGKVEVVVFLFEAEPDPKKFSWRQTWYAEHAEESTLCFFATPYMNELIGPGIGQSIYGGCMMIFPPRTIPNIWEDPRLRHGKTLDEKLLEAAFFHSRNKAVVVVSQNLPSMTWRKLSRIYKKKIIHIPLKRFSNQTIEKIRCFHVLNGKEIRSFASRFIDNI